MAKGRKRLPQSKIIEQFVAAHGDRYDYSTVVYRTVHDKVTIVCREHGPFEQNPKNHRRGAVCPGCVTGRIQDTCMSRYGVRSGAMTLKARTVNSAKMKRQRVDGSLAKAMIAKYGGLGWDVPDIRSRAVSTMMSRHGVANGFDINRPAQSAKAKATRIKNGQYVHPSKIRDFIKYKREVWRQTNRNVRNAHWLGVRSREMHLDHIYSILDGFENNVIPAIVASPCNLQIIPGRLNRQKGSTSWMSLPDLLLLVDVHIK